MVTYLRMVRSTSASPQNMSYSSSSVNIEISSTGTTAEITFVALYDAGLMIITMKIMIMTITMIHMLITMVIMIAMMMIKNNNNDTDYDRLVIKQDS